MGMSSSSSSQSHHLIPLLLLLLLTLPVFTAAQSHHNITLNSSLSPLGKNTSWVSPSGEFAFGFRPLESNASLYQLAIWFNKLANKTVVWSAKGNTPLQDRAKLELKNDGRLVLTGDDGKELWKIEVSDVTHAKMLDTGNFVLASKNTGDYRWESFKSPTDTILPTQVLGRGGKLTARLMETDYSDGRFELGVDSDGELRFYPVSYPTELRYDSYWSTRTNGNGTKLGFNETGNVYFALSNGSFIDILTGSSSTSSSTGGFYQRATLDPDGVLRSYVCPKNRSQNQAWGGTSDWSNVASLPPDICQAVRTGMGSGACGFNSYCILDSNQRSDCKCPLRYSFVDPDRKYKGCKPDFAAQSCDNSATAAFEMTEMVNTDWPLSDYEAFDPITEEFCRENCLNDCFCAVAIYRDGQCWKKKLPLSNGQMNPSVGGKALLKVSRSGDNTTTTTFNPPNPSSSVGEKDPKSWLVPGSLMLATSVLLNFVFIAAMVFLVSRSRQKMIPKPQLESDMLVSNLHSFTYKELEKATEGFKEELGRGSFGTVYKGLIESNSGTLVAVKKLQKLEQSAEKEFVNEVRAISQTHHKNLVRLLGFCNEGPHRLLVYEFMSHGSLTSFLHGSFRPDWNLRAQIALGITGGIMYLHEECSTQIIHCDIKPQNILLDDHFIARISDFGIAKLLRTDQTRTSTGIRGTRGYVAPEWFRNMAITAKVDVYSFGVMLLEIICCRKNVEQESSDDAYSILTDWAYDCYRDGRLDMLVEDDEGATADMRRLERFVKVALWCIQEEPSLRPTMKKVRQMLEGAVEVSVPPNPSSFISSIN